MWTLVPAPRATRGRRAHRALMAHRDRRATLGSPVRRGKQVLLEHRGPQDPVLRATLGHKVILVHRAIRAHRADLVRPERRALEALRVRKATRALRGILVRRVTPELRELLDHKGSRETKGATEPKAHLGRKATPAHKGLKESRAIKGLQAAAHREQPGLQA